MKEKIKEAVFTEANTPKNKHLRKQHMTLYNTEALLDLAISKTAKAILKEISEIKYFGWAPMDVAKELKKKWCE